MKWFNCIPYISYLIHVEFDISLHGHEIAKYDEIKSGQFHPFTGPIYDNQGNLVIKDGHTVSDEELDSINWYVKGIDATIPK